MSTVNLSTKRLARRASPTVRRLTSLDRMYLRSEDAAWPGHFGGLAIVKGGPLLDGSGQLRLAEIRERLDRRLTRVPELRRRLSFPGLFRGGPIWVDDQRFDIQNHVFESALDAPCDDAALLKAAARLYGPLLDRTRPLWELWFLTGLGDDRVGVLLKLHHAVADGSAVVRVMGSLFDVAPDAPEPVAPAWTPDATPRGRSLLADDLSTKLRALSRAVTPLAHPRRLVGGARAVALVMRRSFGDARAARSSLNAPVRPGRRVAYLQLDLAAMKAAAHTHGGTVNDVVLDLWSGGLRQLLASRGEAIAGLELITSQPVSTRAAGDGTVGNQVGNVVLPLPLGEADPSRRLEAIVQATRRSKAEERPAATTGVLARLAAMPLRRYLTLHQRAVNVKLTNVVGPPIPMSILGAPILDILPITQLLGNVGLSLCAFSYAGQMALVVTADASRFPDLDLLIGGMKKDWEELIEGHVAEPVTPEPADRAGPLVAADSYGGLPQ